MSETMFSRMEASQVEKKTQKLHDWIHDKCIPFISQAPQAVFATSIECMRPQNSHVIQRI